MKNSKDMVVITGASGFLGSYVKPLFNAHYENIYCPTRTEMDLLDVKATQAVLDKLRPRPSLIVHLAGITDGVRSPHKAHFMRANMMMGLTVSFMVDIYNAKLVNVGTVCSYPGNAQLPFKEEDFFFGRPERSNAGYGIGKRAIIEYYQQLDEYVQKSSTHLILSNLYGYGQMDNHVINDLYRKFTIIPKKSTLTLLGSGKETRDFLHVRDAARAILMASLDYKNEFVICNIGTGVETPISKVVELLRKKFGYPKKISYTGRDNGQSRRVVDTSLALDLYGFKSEIDIKDGIDDLFTNNVYCPSYQNLLNFS